MKYQDLLQDPRWQRKRLYIFNRDDFTCQRCGDDRNTLCVHHLAYFPGRKPWEYEGEYLITWCVDCHENEHVKINFMDAAEKIICRTYTPERSLLLDRLIEEHGI